MKKKDKIDPEFKRFFGDFYDFLLKSIKVAPVITKETLKDIVKAYAVGSVSRYQIKMTKKYRKFIEEKLKAQLKKAKLMEKSAPKMPKLQEIGKFK